MAVVMAPLRHYIFCLMVGIQMFNNNGLIRTDFESISGLHAVSKEHLNGCLITKVDVWVHTDAVSAPEVVQVALADPLL